METKRIMETNTIWILKFRDFTIKDLKLGVRSKDTAKSALRFFDEGGYIIPIRPEWEWQFLCGLVKSHPVNKRDFEHFLTKTRTGILPSEILKNLKERSELIPTLAVVKLTRDEAPDLMKWDIEDVTKIMDANGLYNLQKEIEAI